MNITDIRNLNPCYDPSKYLKEDWEGTITEFLQIDTIPAKDRLWVALREDFIEASIIKRFALNSAKHVKHLMKDDRSLKALEVIEAYLEDKASLKKLRIAWDAAAYAADDAASRAAAYAADAYSAAYSAASASYAAYSAEDAAYDAAYSAYAAYSASATYAATYAANAAYSAASVASDAERNYQINMLIELLG